MKNLIVHCNCDNAVTEKWVLKDDTILLFSVCQKCMKKLALLIDANTGFPISRIYVNSQIEKLKKRKKKQVKYKDFDTPSIRNWGFVFGVNVEIHDCKGRIRAIRQKAKDFFGCENLIKEIESCK